MDLMLCTQALIPLIGSPLPPHLDSCFGVLYLWHNMLDHCFYRKEGRKVLLLFIPVFQVPRTVPITSYMPIKISCLNESPWWVSIFSHPGDSEFSYYPISDDSNTVVSGAPSIRSQIYMTSHGRTAEGPNSNTASGFKILGPFCYE